MRANLRLFTNDDFSPQSPQASPQVSIRLGEFCRILADALGSHRTWVQDFADDPIDVPADLYDVLTAYGRLRPGA
jgi:hypothetical protein